MARTKQTARKFSKRPVEGTFGYSCTLYKDFLIFFGGTYDGEPIVKISVYSLEEQKMVKNQSRQASIAFGGRFGHSACYYDQGGIIIFFGGEPSHGGFEDSYTNPALKLVDEGDDGLSWNLIPGIEGEASESPISHLYENRIYLYQSGGMNGNFGLLRYYDIGSSQWQEPYQGVDKWLKMPCDKAMFVKNKLYLFAESEYPTPRAMPVDGRFIEDVHVFDFSGNGNKWEKVSFSGEAPGLVSNISMTEANGIIYIFGFSHNDEGEKKSVLWAFDTNEEKWSIVQDSESLTARPNQRAVIYKGQLLIIDWDALTQTIGIQYQTLSGGVGNLISQLPSGKSLCKDQDEGFIQDAKSLYNSRLFPDIVFEVEGEEISAHRALLAYRSDYFMKLLTESSGSKIPISNMKSHIFKAILQYVYCNELELDEQLTLDLIPVIDEYLMKGLKGICEKYLCKQLRKENVVDMLIVADKHEIQDLKKACFKFILKNLASFDENEEIMKLSKSLFLELLKFNTPGLQQKNNTTKSEKKEPEETKSNFGVAMKSSPKKASTMKAPTTFAMNYAEPYRQTNTGFSFGAAPAFKPVNQTNPTMAIPTIMPARLRVASRSRSKSRSRSPVQIARKAEK